MTPDIAKALDHKKPLHKKLKEALIERLRMSERRMKDRYKQMAQNEELFQAYIPVREVDRLRKVNREQYGMPEYTTIELPYAYSVVMTAHTYYSSVFCARNPVLQLMGRHGESEQKVQAMETLLSYQMSVGANMLPLFVWLLDPGKYGFGVVGHYWDSETYTISRVEERVPDFFGVPIQGAAAVKELVEEQVTGYEGNRIYNVRPQDWLPDPRVALVHFQKGEFCGRYVETSWNEIFEGSRKSDGQYRFFNYEELLRLRANRDHEQSSGQVHRDEGSGNVTTLPGAGALEDGKTIPVGFVKGHEVYMKLIPRDWGIGTATRQQIWVFNLTTTGLIFGGGPLGELANKFPFDVITDEIDGYSIFPKSTLERCKPLNDVMTWLINTHFYNVRATLNNQFVVDPSKVVMKDAENPRPGKLIRLKPIAYGTDVRTVLAQLQVGDVTRGHVADLSMVMDMVQRMVPANDSLMGVQPSGSSRQTATSVRTSTHFSTSRLKTQCEWWSAGGWTPLTQKLVQRTQQRYSAEKQFRLVGDLAQFSSEFVNVTPADIAGFYDYEPVDGTLPVDRFAQANLWQMIMQSMEKHPEILMTYDIAKIFAWVAQLAGIKNLAQFRLTPNELMQRQIQSGNVIPFAQANKEVTGSASPPAPRRNQNEPKQLPNMGPTG